MAVGPYKVQTLFTKRQTQPTIVRISHCKPHQERQLRFNWYPSLYISPLCINPCSSVLVCSAISFSLLRSKSLWNLWVMLLLTPGSPRMKFKKYCFHSPIRFASKVHYWVQCKFWSCWASSMQLDPFQTSLSIVVFKQYQSHDSGWNVARSDLLWRSWLPFRKVCSKSHRAAHPLLVRLMIQPVLPSWGRVSSQLYRQHWTQTLESSVSLRWPCLSTSPEYSLLK